MHGVTAVAAALPGGQLFTIGRAWYSFPVVRVVQLVVGTITTGTKNITRCQRNVRSIATRGFLDYVRLAHTPFWFCFLFGLQKASSLATRYLREYDEVTV
nr:unnamed protein product [Callosobruchus chinensis]